MKKPILVLLFLMLTLFSKAQSVNSSAKDSIFTAVEIEATFPGGNENFIKFIGQNIRYPAISFERHIHGKVFVQFIIQKNGKVTNATIVRSVSADIDSEALRVVRLSPNWHPAIQNGNMVASTFTVPIVFNISPTIINMNNNSVGSVVNIDTTREKTKISDQDALDQPASNKPPVVPQFNNTQIFTAVEIEPSYPGGQAKLNEYIAANQRAQDNTGVVYAQFVVEKDGSLSDFKILRSPSDAVSAEAIRLLSKCPKWTPGMQNGHVVRCYFTLPIRFNN